ncbi:MAG TPA: HupE/UreJ family protein [Holophagaceae bacterium]|nr:HupE/UreJ family protein [Holophagaceae bacterium]
MKPLLRALLLLGSLALAPALSAHELGALHATVTLATDGRWRAEVVMDLEHVPPGLRPPDPATPVQQDAWRAGILAALRPAFDGLPVQPSSAAFAGLKDGLATQPMFRLEGAIPPGARTFSWTYAGALPEYLLTLRREGEEGSWSQWLPGGRPSQPFELGSAFVPGTWLRTAGLYLRLGFTHIVPEGLDHILFVLGLFLLSLQWRPLLAQTGAFTLAHSITLGLAMLGLVSLPPRVVEPAIALSIAFVAIENLFRPDLSRWRVALVFTFGLVHGLGFAGVLKDLGLPRGQFAPALLAFNLGVELGQLAVIAVAFLVVGSWARRKAWYRERVAIPASCLIAGTGLFWTVQRLFFQAVG